MTVRRLGLVLLVAALAPLGHASGAADAASGAAKTVQIEDFDYTPERVVVRTGQRVRWVNQDFANHSVTLRSGRRIASLHEDESGTLRFRKPGRYRYICDFHPSMHGVVVVRR